MSSNMKTSSIKLSSLLVSLVKPSSFGDVRDDIPPVDNWILATGFWRDEGEWIDTKFWID